MITVATIAMSSFFSKGIICRTYIAMVSMVAFCASVHAIDATFLRWQRLKINLLVMPAVLTPHTNAKPMF